MDVVAQRAVTGASACRFHRTATTVSNTGSVYALVVGSMNAPIPKRFAFGTDKTIPFGVILKTFQGIDSLFMLPACVYDWEVRLDFVLKQLVDKISTRIAFVCTKRLGMKLANPSY